MLVITVLGRLRQEGGWITDTASLGCRERPYLGQRTRMNLDPFPFPLFLCFIFLLVNKCVFMSRNLNC